MRMIIPIKKLKEDAILPSYAHTHDAGMDLYTVKDLLIKNGERANIPTGIAMAIPEGYAGLIWDKSGLSMNHGLKTLGGVVDAGYRGEIMVGVVNVGGKDYMLEKGNKIAQMLIQKVESPTLKEVTDLVGSERGGKGFGSTGK